MPAHPHTFPKHEHLSKKKEIDFLFSSGKSFSKFPFRVIFIIKKAEEKKEGNEFSTKLSSPSPLERELGGRGARMAVSVPKKKIKRAVDRNRIKRLTREGYRLNKQLLTDVCKNKNAAIDFMLIYTGNVNPEFITVQSKIVLILQRLNSIIQQGNAPSDDSLTKVL